MSTNMNDPYEEALAGMAGNNPNRQPVNMDMVSSMSFPSANPASGTLMPKGNTAAADPTVMPNPKRSNVPYAVNDRSGATYGIRVSYTAQTSPEASYTMSGGRVFKSAVNRSRMNFDQGNATSY